MEWSQRADDHDSCKLPVLRSLPGQYKGLWAQMPVEATTVNHEAWPDARLWFHDAPFYQACAEVRTLIIDNRNQGSGFDRQYNALAGSQWKPDDRRVGTDRTQYRTSILQHATSIAADVLLWDCGTGLGTNRSGRNHVLRDDVEATLTSGMTAAFYQHPARFTKSANHHRRQLPMSLLRIPAVRPDQLIAFEHEGTRIVVVAPLSRSRLVDEWMSAVRTKWFPLIRVERCRLCEATGSYILLPV